MRNQNRTVRSRLSIELMQTNKLLYFCNCLHWYRGKKIWVLYCVLPEKYFHAQKVDFQKLYNSTFRSIKKYIYKFHPSYTTKESN